MGTGAGSHAKSVKSVSMVRGLLKQGSIQIESFILVDIQLGPLPFARMMDLDQGFERM